METQMGMLVKFDWIFLFPSRSNEMVHTDEEEKEDCHASSPPLLVTCTRAFVDPTVPCQHIVLPLRAYERTLGMRAPAALRRQLNVDTPRNQVFLNGQRIHDAHELYNLPVARLCTQAVLAPPVEWILRAQEAWPTSYHPRP